MAMTNAAASWGKIVVKAGKTGASDAMATALTDIGHIKEGTYEITTDEGDKMQAIATGGNVIFEEQKAGVTSVSFRMIEPSDGFFTQFGVGKAGTGSMKFTDTIVKGYYSIDLAPQNTGARGFRAPKCSVSISLGHTDEEGMFADVVVTPLLTTAATDNYRFEIYEIK